MNELITDAGGTARMRFLEVFTSMHSSTQIFIAAAAGLELPTNSLEDYRESLYNQWPVKLFRT